jgi:hypothetical protein
VGAGENTPSEGQNEIFFPQVANGALSGGKISAFLVLVNRTQATAYGEVSFFKSDGTPFSVTLLNGSHGSSFNFTIEPGGSEFQATDGSGDLSVGYARITSTVPLGGVLVFTTRDSGGFPTAEAGVGASAAAKRFSIPVLLSQEGSNTGIALANISETDAFISLDLKGLDGIIQEQTTLSLNAGEHLPRFASELFSSLDGLADFEGVIEVSSSVPISAIALKTEGSLLTTFPVVTLP